MPTEFRVLGDVEAYVEARPVDIGHARQRCVLAVLLIEANRPVPADALIERIWADRSPRHARGALHNYLSRLRQALALAPDVTIARHTGGYLLAVDPLTVDVHRFDHLVAGARSAHGDAATLIDEALRLWRGRPLAILDTPWANGVRAELDSRRRLAERDRVDRELADGRHADLLSSLSVAVAADPFDERLVGQYMTALYRTGRQADALAQFEQLRRRLADQLGADPSPAVRLVHRRILTGDPVLVGHGRAAPRPGVPRQLPAAPSVFAGRTAEIALLDALLPADGGDGDAMVIAAVSGTAGVGKTALALHWAHRAAHRFPDGTLYVSLRGFDPSGRVMTVDAAIRVLLDSLQVPVERIPVGLSAQAALYRSIVANRRLLVVLDNARDTEQVRLLLPGTPGCMVLVTSRNTLLGLVTAEGAHAVALGVLDNDDARRLLIARLGGKRMAASPEAVEALITSCAGLPLALAIVSAHAAVRPHFSIRAIVEDLGDPGDRLDALANEEPATDPRAVFSWSYRALSVAAARLFRLLGLHPGPDISVAAAASLVGAAPGAVRPALMELCRGNLVTEHSPGRFAYHDLLRVYAGELARRHETEPQRLAAMSRLCDHYLHSALAAASRQLLSQGPRIAAGPVMPAVTPETPADHREAVAWFTAELPVLRGMLTYAAGAGLKTHVWQLARALTLFLDRTARWQDLADAHRLALRVASHDGDGDGIAQARAGLARACVGLGHYDEAQAHLEHLLEWYGQQEDWDALSSTHSGSASLFERLNCTERALTHARQALNLAESTGRPTDVANALNNVGWLTLRLGDAQQARSLCQRALDLYRQFGNTYGIATTSDSLASAHHHLGEYGHAVRCYRQALQVFDEFGDTRRSAHTLHRLGDTYRAVGDRDGARRCWREASVLLERLGHPDLGLVDAKVKELEG